MLCIIILTSLVKNTLYNKPTIKKNILYKLKNNIHEAIHKF